MYHVPVLLDQVERYLAPAPGKILVDATVGGGGYAQRLLSRLVPDGFLIGIDLDEEAIRESSGRLGPYRENLLLVRDNFTNLGAVVDRMKFRGVDGIVADLGVSSHQLDEPSRGFSFRHAGPLDMRFSKTLPVRAEQIVNRSSEEEIRRILREYGQERFARRIARAILRARPLFSTDALADLVRRTIPRRFHETGKHPATRTFQALRIAVNQELESLRRLLQAAPPLLREGGVMVVVSYHSLEDRLVKARFRELSREGYENLTRKPVLPEEAERRENPRSRSARLRAIRRVSSPLTATGDRD